MPADVRAGYLAPYDSWANRIAVHRFVQDIPLEGRAIRSIRSSAASRRNYTVFRTCRRCYAGGEQDFVFDGHFLAEWTAPRLPHAEVHRFPDRSGHYVLEDCRDEIVPPRPRVPATAVGEGRHETTYVARSALSRGCRCAWPDCQPGGPGPTPIPRPAPVAVAHPQSEAHPQSDSRTEARPDPRRRLRPPPCGATGNSCKGSGPSSGCTPRPAGARVRSSRRTFATYKMMLVWQGDQLSVVQPQRTRTTGKVHARPRRVRRSGWRRKPVATGGDSARPRKAYTRSTATRCECV